MDVPSFRLASSGPVANPDDRPAWGGFALFFAKFGQCKLHLEPIVAYPAFKPQSFDIGSFHNPYGLRYGRFPRSFNNLLNQQFFIKRHTHLFTPDPCFQSQAIQT